MRVSFASTSTVVFEPFKTSALSSSIVCVRARSARATSSRVVFNSFTRSAARVASKSAMVESLQLVEERAHFGGQWSSWVRGRRRIGTRLERVEAAGHEHVDIVAPEAAFAQPLDDIGPGERF